MLTERWLERHITHRSLFCRPTYASMLARIDWWLLSAELTVHQQINRSRESLDFIINYLYTVIPHSTRTFHTRCILMLLVMQKSIQIYMTAKTRRCIFGKKVQVARTTTQHFVQGFYGGSLIVSDVLGALFLWEERAVGFCKKQKKLTVHTLR